jgi:putative ABC transport system permease protein
MSLFATFKLALRALRRNLLRTLLTMLGIIIGVAAVIAVVSLGNGAKKQVEANIAGLGQNVVMIFAGNVSRGGFSMGFGSAPTLSEGDLQAIRHELDSVVGASPEVRTSAQVAAGNQNEQVQVSGVNEDYVSVRSWPVEDGRNFSDLEVRSAAKVALIGKTTKDTLFGDSNPVGQIIRIKNAPFIVVGTLSAKGMNMGGQDQDDIVLVPYTSALKRLMGGTMLRSILVQVASANEFVRAKADLDGLLRQRHKIVEGKDSDFLIRTQEEISTFATATSRTMTILLGGVAGVSLLVGGIGIMNIMLVSVTERTREIGVRLAIGARTGDILNQFLIEAVTLSALGGLIGIGLGFWTSGLLARLMDGKAEVATNSVVIAFASAAGIGVCFGFFPAVKAAHLDPIDALRYE